MKKLITYSEQDVMDIHGLLNRIVVSGVQNCKNIAIIVQILESGKLAEIKDDGKTDKKEGDE